MGREERYSVIYVQLFANFLFVGLFSVGGGYAAMPLIESCIVQNMKWLTIEEFTNLITIAEMTPGPIAVNAATFVGMRIAGIGGAICATLGCITPSLLLVSLLAWIYRKYRKAAIISDMLGGLRPAVAALIASAGLMILRVVVFDGSQINLIETGLFASAFFALRKTKLNPILVMLLCGASALGLHILTGGIAG